MASTESHLDPESTPFHESPSRPNFYIGQHDSRRQETLTNAQYGQVVESGFNFVTAPVTTAHFKERVVALYRSHLAKRQQWSDHKSANPSLPVPIVASLGEKDTSLFPGGYTGNAVAYSSPWIDLCSSDPLICSLSRQVLNLEVAYANFCGVRCIVIPGPRDDEDGRGLDLFARAMQEALAVASRLNLMVHLPMYREPGLEEKEKTLSETLVAKGNGVKDVAAEDIDLFGTWDTWHTIRTVCTYSPRLLVALRLPRRMPEKALQDRWFAEPLQLLTVARDVFQQNKAGHPVLGKGHQHAINMYMRLKNAPWVVLGDVGPDFETPDHQMAVDFPSLSDSAKTPLKENRKPTPSPPNAFVGYMRYLERQQEPYSAMESSILVSFQDWLQSPLQPLSDNLESSTYEMFESDPVKYDQYELAITEAMTEWKQLQKPCSSVICDAHPEPELVVAVAGAGRGPLVTRVLRSADRTGTKIQLWALEKNHNAYVYLLRQNEREWGGRVTIIKTDMRGWQGPRPKSSPDIGKVDILVSELLGSFGDNELSPECLDGVQRHLAKPHGISIPRSYTAHLSPIATPRLYQDLSTRVIGEPNAFEIPWVTRLFQLDFVAQKGVPGHPRFQQAWEFVHPVDVLLADDFAVEHGMGATFSTQGYGSMAVSGGLNEHNSRHCHLTFVCRTQGVVHGLAGYFESTLYAPETAGKDSVEISILPEQIDRKSKDMVSWFPIFFPLKEPLYFPRDAELQVSMWRQTDDTKVWYEWIVTAYAWVGPKTRVKVGASAMHSSRKTACLM